LYLCPIFEAYSNHKYDTGDYMQVDPMFGGREALDRLITAGQESGIRILLDGVFNHTGSISRYFNADGRYDSIGAAQSQSSPYYSWYHFDRYPDEYRCWWGVRILPTVNSSNLEYIRFITGEDGVADTYLSAGISGFRLDVADELNENFLRSLRERAKSISPENALIGEVWEDASNKIAYDKRRRYFRGEELDSVMNYPLKNAILDFLLSKNAEGFSSQTRRIYAHYPRFVSESLMNLLGTHDTERILSVLGGQDISGLSYAEMKDLRLSAEAREIAKKRLRLAYAILTAMPGIPCIYYGDEVGMEGAKDPFNRRTYPWGREDQDLLSFFREMGDIRKEWESVLTHGYYRVLYAHRGQLVLSREAECGSLVLCLNAEEVPFTYPCDGIYADVRNNQTVSGEVDVPSLDFRILYQKALA
jgi:glycosidase